MSGALVSLGDMIYDELIIDDDDDDDDGDDEMTITIRCKTLNDVTANGKWSPAGNGYKNNKYRNVS